MVEILNKNKYGFSLAEALISMLVLSIFFLATYKVTTQKEPEDIVVIPHGFYECFRVGSSYTQRYSFNGASVVESANVSQCRFSPQKNTSAFNVTRINSGENPNVAVRSVIMQIDRDVMMVPPGSFRVAGEDNVNRVDWFGEAGTESLASLHELMQITQSNSHYARNDANEPGFIIQW